MDSKPEAANMDMKNSMCGVILCGGKSQRFGSDKALVVYEGESLVHRAYGALTAIASEIVIAAGPSGRSYKMNAPHIHDLREDAGPLAGIEAAFAATTAETLLVLATDLPLISSEHLQAIVNGYRQPLTIARDEMTKREQPLCALWHRTLEEPLTAYLDAGHRSVMGFVHTQPFFSVDVMGGRLQNVNYSHDLPASNGK